MQEQLLSVEQPYRIGLEVITAGKSEANPRWPHAIYSLDLMCKRSSGNIYIIYMLVCSNDFNYFHVHSLYVNGKFYLVSLFYSVFDYYDVIYL